MFDAEPDGWEQTTLGAIATLGGGTTPSKSEEGYWSDGSIPWATPSDITSLPSGTARISATEVVVTDRALKECSLPLNPPGTVLMTSRATIGYAALNDVPMATNQGFIAFRCGDRADPEFLLHWLTAKRDFLVAAAGGSTFKELSRGTAKLLPILLPPLHEQRRIAEVLRSVDTAIAAAQAVVVQARHLLDGHLSALMESGIAALAEPASGGLPKGWSEGRCDTYFIRQRGFDITESQAIAGPFHVFSSSGPSYSHSEAAVEGPAVITGRKGRLGTVFYSADPCWPHDTTLWVKSFKGNNPRFVYWKLREMKLDAYDAATSVPTLNRNNVHALTVRFPSLTEQSKIAEVLDAHEDAIAQSAAAVDALVKAKEVLMSDLLSGHVRVPA